MITNLRIFCEALEDMKNPAHAAEAAENIILLLMEEEKETSGKYKDTISDLCKKLAAARSDEQMKFLEMKIAATCMLDLGYCFNERAGYYERG